MTKTKIELINTQTTSLANLVFDRPTDLLFFDLVFFGDANPKSPLFLVINFKEIC